MKNKKVSVRGVVDLISKVRGLANRYITESLEVRGIDGIVPAHGQVLLPLFHAEAPLRLSDIVQKSGRAKSTVTGMVKTLEKLGYIEKRASGTDGRSKYLALTEKGKALEPVFREISAALIQNLYKNIGSDDQEKLIDLLSRVEENLLDILINEE